MNDVPIMSYFVDEGTTFFAHGESKGSTWASVRPKTFLCPQNGNRLIRDPFLGKGVDGNFHMLYTEGWCGKSFGYARSNDLLHWGEQKNEYIMQNVDMCKSVWAPEFVVDPVGQDHMVHWTAFIGNQPMIWYSHTKDFYHYMSPRVLFDPGFPVIDATVVQDGRRFIMAFKDESKDVQAIRLAFADTLIGPYKNITRPVTPPFTEGPILSKIGGSWHLYYDRFKDNAWGCTATENFAIWHDVPVTIPWGARHGSICNITKRELQKLLASNKSIMMT